MTIYFQFLQKFSFNYIINETLFLTEFPYFVVFLLPYKFSGKIWSLNFVTFNALDAMHSKTSGKLSDSLWISAAIKIIVSPFAQTTVAWENFIWSVCGWHGVTGCDPQTAAEFTLWHRACLSLPPRAQQRVLCLCPAHRCINLIKNVSDVRLFSWHTGILTLMCELAHMNTQ